MVVRAHFLDTGKVNDKGQYKAKLLCIKGHPPVPWNFNLARKVWRMPLLKRKESKLKARKFIWIGYKKASLKNCCISTCLVMFLCIYLLTYSMEQSPSSEANWFCS